MVFDGMVVGFTTTCAISAINTKVVSLNPARGEVYLIQHHVIKFVSDLRQVGGFLRVLRFPPPIKLTNNINEILLKVELNAITLTPCVIDQSMICLCYMKKMFLGAASQNPRVSA